MMIMMKRIVRPKRSERSASVLRVYELCISSKSLCKLTADPPRKGSKQTWKLCGIISRRWTIMQNAYRKLFLLKRASEAGLLICVQQRSEEDLPPSAVWAFHLDVEAVLQRRSCFHEVDGLFHNEPNQIWNIRSLWGVLEGMRPLKWRGIYKYVALNVRADGGKA